MLDLISTERRRIADWLETMPADAWDAPTLCERWSVSDVVGHLTFTWRLSTPRLLAQIVRHRGFHEASAVGGRRLGAVGAEALIGSLRDHAEDPAKPPGAYEGDLLAEVVIHPMDIAVPNSLEWEPTGAAIGPLLEYLTTHKKGREYHPPGGIDGMRWVATDLDWAWGDGPVIEGRGHELAMVMSSRPRAVEWLEGDGVQRLRTGRAS